MRRFIKCSPWHSYAALPSACDIVAHLLIGERGVFAVTCNISCALWVGQAGREVNTVRRERNCGQESHMETQKNMFHIHDSPVREMFNCWLNWLYKYMIQNILLCDHTVDDGKVFWGLIVSGRGREGEWALYHAAFYAAVHITLTLHTPVNTTHSHLRGALWSLAGAKWQRHLVSSSLR